VIAHRGDSQVAPENTLPSFTSAIAAGADLVELDYRQTSDGVPVVFHDDELDRCTDACRVWATSKILLDTKTVSELGELDAGAWFDPSFAGTRVPTLEAALDLIRDSRPTMVERKAGDATTCVRLLERLQAIDQVVLTAFDWQYLADCHRQVPALILGALGTKPLSPAHVAEAMAAGARMLGWNDADVTRGHIDLVHRSGLKAWVWTVDDPLRAEQLIAWGIDGLISNRPALIRAVVARQASPKR
jgi:glycerophosphoryl diester phosphodiesterase